MKLEVGPINKWGVAIIVAGVALIGWRLWSVYGDHNDAAVMVKEDVPAAQHRLQRLREIAATVPAREQLLKQAQAELATRETGVLLAPTEAQAQAQLLGNLNDLAKANGITTQGSEFRDRVLTKDYGEVGVTVRFNCRIEQLVNLLAAIADQPQILATNELRLYGGTDKNKVLQAMLTVTAVVPRKLLPDKKGGNLF
ncbi:MAG TPA: type II secretion system protein GspM [Verrucomicrobiae bacterium]|nr:type II secretion system protein GspM [Verrucomicrobiae bacterium]